VLDEHARGDLVFPEHDPVTGGAKAPHAPKCLPVLERVATAGTIVQFEGT
jgi:hypothetical protein